MAKRVAEVQKFGGVEELGEATTDATYELRSIETQSDTRLDNDEGNGNPAIIRCFTFKTNPDALKEHIPTKQELFNAHAKGIEMSLWKDGMTPVVEIPPRIITTDTQYQIFVTARPMRGHILREQTHTLTDLVHGRSTE